MAQLHSHINFNGNAREAFDFYAQALGGNVGEITYLKDQASPDFTPTPEDADKIMYIPLLRNGEVLLSGNDVPSFLGATNERENRSKIEIKADSKEEAVAIYTALSAEAEIEVPLDKSAEDACFAMFRDKYGIEWIINYKSFIH